MEAVSNYKQKIQFVTGFAGSGKSTKLAESAVGKEDVLVLTPTHKAAEVLMAKGIVNVFTIHSVLKLVPTINENFRRGQRMQKLKKIGGVDLADIGKIAIDEFSMIPVDIMDMLLELLPEHCLVLVFGDPFQLPPIDGEAVDPLTYTDNILELTTQHRAEAPEVVETFMRFMHYIKGDGEMNLKMNPAIKEGNLDDFNPGTDRILAYTNDKVLELNAMAAKVLGKPEAIAVNEDITMNGIPCMRNIDGLDIEGLIYPTCISKGKLMQGNKLSKAMLKTQEDIIKFRTNLSMYDNYAVKTSEGTYVLFYDLKHYANAKLLKAEVEKYQHLVVETHGLKEEDSVKEFCYNNKGKQYVKERGTAWKNYLAHQNLVFDIRRPFATTIHKAQGQEFDTVYIAQTDIKRSIRQGYYLQYAKLMYVALSRARKRVVLV